MQHWDAAIATTAQNPGGVGPFTFGFIDPPKQAGCKISPTRFSGAHAGSALSRRMRASGPYWPGGGGESARQRSRRASISFSSSR